MEEVSVLIGKSQSGDKEAREVLIEKNLGLVHHIVKRFLGRGYDPEDLFQIGVIGLMKAIDKFDLKLEVRFSTYAVPMITGEIKRFLRDDGLLKVSRTIKEDGLKVRLARQRLQSRLHREPTLQELSEEAQLDREDVILAMEAGADYIAPYFNRMENMGLDSDDVIASLADMIDLYHYDTQILAASFKNAGQIDRAFLAGAHTATMDPSILKDVLTQPYITNAVDTFDSDWKTIFGDQTISEL